MSDTAETPDSEKGATTHMDIEGAPTFPASAKLETWDAPDGSVTGMRYSETKKIMERDDHVAKVREVMERDAESQ